MENSRLQKHELNVVSRKIIIVLGLVLVLMIPLSMVKSQISSRHHHETVAQSEVAKGWGGDVKYSTPYLSLVDRDIQPKLSETQIEVVSQEKTRGIFQVPVFTTILKSKVTFERSTEVVVETETEKKISKTDFMMIPVTPVSSIQSFKIVDSASGKALNAALVSNGIQLLVNDLPGKDPYGKAFSVEITTRGTGLIQYESNSDQDKLKMVGNWPKPMFVDDLLPNETQLSSDGFEAQWTINTLPRWASAPRESKTIGLKHLWIGTDYLKIERAVKYGILFITLTFLLFFIVEFMGDVRIHPLQYSLIGLSISVFYLLLLALSEAISFNQSYLFASMAVTGLIVFYVRGFLNKKKFVSMILAQQVILNSFFFILLSLEERAFLIGTLGLFVALATFMTVTRRFDWYSGSFKVGQEA